MIIPKLIQNCRECKTCKVMVQTQTPSYRHNLVSTCSLFSSKREQKLTHSFSYCWFILESHKKKVGKKKQTNKKELHIIQAYNFSISLSFLIGSTKDTFFKLQGTPFICILFKHFRVQFTTGFTNTWACYGRTDNGTWDKTWLMMLLLIRASSLILDAWTWFQRLRWSFIRINAFSSGRQATFWKKCCNSFWSPDTFFCK